MSATNDPAKTWEDMLDHISKSELGSEGTDFVKAMLAPVQKQFEILGSAFEKQAEFQRDLSERALAPMKQMYVDLQEAAETTRAAGAALRQAGDMLTRQSEAMDHALQLAKPFIESALPSPRESSED